MDKKQKDIIKYILSAGVAVLLLWLSFRGVKWSDFISGLKACRWSFIAMSMGFGVLAFWLRGLRWRQLLLPIDPATRRITTFNAVNISYIANIVLPRVGEIISCGFINKHSELDPSTGRRRATVDKVLGTVVVDRFWDIMFLIIPVLLLAFAFKDEFGSFFGRLLGDSSFNVSWLVVIVLAVAAALLLAAWYFREKSTIAGKIWGLVQGVWKGATSCLSGKTWWKCLLLTAGVWFCYWMTTACVVWAMQGMDEASLSESMASSLQVIRSITFMDALLLMLAGSLASFVPVPGGFGAFHYITCLALSSLYGIPMEMGIIFATLSHESQAIVQILAGGASYIYESASKPEYPVE